MRLTSRFSLTLENYAKLCSIEVDLSHLRSKAEQLKKIGPEGAYYRLHYKLILLFGLSELKAVFSWKENVSGSFLAQAKWVTDDNSDMFLGCGEEVSILGSNVQPDANQTPRSPAKIIYDPEDVGIRA